MSEFLRGDDMNIYLCSFKENFKLYPKVTMQFYSLTSNLFEFLVGLLFTNNLYSQPLQFQMV